MVCSSSSGTLHTHKFNGVCVFVVWFVWLCACMRACVCACVRACVCVCVRACVCVCVCVCMTFWLCVCVLLSFWVLLCSAGRTRRSFPRSCATCMIMNAVPLAARPHNIRKHGDVKFTYFYVLCSSIILANTRNQFWLVREIIASSYDHTFTKATAVSG